MKFISVIPARSGSKGIKNKNIIKIGNKPLVQHTFEAALKSKIHKNFVLTDSLKIKNIAKKFNINDKYSRPKKLSKSTTSLTETLHHFNNWLKKNKIHYDFMVILQPTSPLRDYRDINKSLDILQKTQTESLFSISESLEHPYEAIIKKKKLWKFVLAKSKKFYRRQDFDIKTYFINGAIYIASKKLISQKKIFTNFNHSFYEMPKNKSLEINDKDEAYIIDCILKRRNK
jgi:CMP-N,N'-diacetyllegionaminic acid synthase